MNGIEFQSLQIVDYGLEQIFPIETVLYRLISQASYKPTYVIHNTAELLY